MIGLILAGIVAAAAYGLPRRGTLAMATLGALAGALLSIKVNVGGFALAAIACACAVSAPLLRERRALSLLVAGAFAAVPVVLLSGKLDDPHTLRYAAIVFAGALAIALSALATAPGPGPSRRELGALGLGALGATGLGAAVPVIGGTSPAELLDGWVLRPAETPDLQFASLFLHELTLVWAALGLASAFAVAWARRARLAVGPRAHGVLALARLAVGFAIWLCLASPVPGLPFELTRGLAVGAPFAWVAAIAPAGSRFSNGFLRVLIPALAVLQALHAFPVPGSQLAWSQFLFVLVGGVCIADGARELSSAGEVLRPRLPSWRHVVTAAVLVFCVWFALKPLRRYAGTVDTAYDVGVPLVLPGAERMRLLPERVAQLEGLVNGIQTKCQTFLTMPGLNSLYLWSEQPVPTTLSGPWTFFLTAEEQREIVADVREESSLCVVRKPDLLEFWAGFSGDRVPPRPLVRFIRRDFEPYRNYSGYLLETRRAPLRRGG